MAQAASAFDDKPAGVQRGRGGFMRGGVGDSPYVSDPTGATVKSGDRKGQIKRLQYGSPSGFGKQIENTFNLQKWGERRVVLGIGAALASGDFTVSQMCFQLSTLDVDSETYKELADQIVVRCKEIAETNLAAERGTHGHAVLEDDDEGRDWMARAEAGELLGIPVDAQHALVQAWRHMLERDGLEVLITEASCIDDTWRLAGTLDNIARCTKELRFLKDGGEVAVIPAGTVLVLDKKTGQRRTKPRSGVIEYWHGYAVQVASYAQSVPYDTEAETRGVWPWEIDQTHALIAHVDILAAIAGAPFEDICTLIYVDLVAGREHGGATVVEAKAWEKRTDVFSVKQLDAQDVVSEQLEPDAEGITESAAEEPAPPTPTEPSAAPSDTATAPVSAPPEPAPIPAPAAPPSPLRESQLARAAIDAEADRRRDAATSFEGDDLSADTYEAMWTLMREQYQALDRPALDWVKQLIGDARDAGVGFQAQSAHTARRSHIYRGLIALAGFEPTDDALWALVELAHGDDPALRATRTAGAALGSLDATAAETFARLVDDYLATPARLVASFTDDGLFVLTPLAAAAA